MKRKRSITLRVTKAKLVKPARLSRRERAERFAEAKAACLKQHVWIELLLKTFGPSWVAFVVWPSIGILWGLLHDANNPFLVPALGAVGGLVVSIYIYFGDTRFSQVLTAFLGLTVGSGLGILFGQSDNVAVWSAIGFVVGLLGRHLVSVIALVFSYG